MKRALMTIAALTFTAGTAFASTFSTHLVDYDVESLTPMQKAQIFGVLNSDASSSNIKRQIESILDTSANTTPELSRAAEAFFEASED